MDQRSDQWFRMEILLSFFLLLSLSVGCVTSASKSTPRGKLHEVAEIFYESLRYRRPGSEAADPRASPGGADFRTRDRANWRSLDCRRPDDFFQKRISEFSFERLDTCLQSVPADTQIQLRLKRGKAPAWMLEIDLAEEDQPGTPDCLVQLLKKIPLPREILFFGRSTEGLVSCFASGQDWEEDIYLDLKIPYFAKKGMTLTLPGSYSDLGKDPRSRVLRWLDSVVVSLWVHPGETGAKVLPAVVFPDEFCKKCLGESEFKRFLAPQGPLPDPWFIRSL